jgi:hypothetical protein
MHKKGFTLSLFSRSDGDGAKKMTVGKELKNFSRIDTRF